MAYSKFYNPALDDDASTPVSAAWANHVEQGIADAIPKAIAGYATDKVPVYNGSDWVAQKIVNAQIDPAAAIAYSKLNLAGSVVRSDLATVTRKLPIPVINWTPVSNTYHIAFSDGISGSIDYAIQLPDDYVSGDVTCKIATRANVTSGNIVRFSWNTYRMRDGSVYANIETNVVDPVGSWTAGATKVVSRAIAAASFVAGDVLRWDLTRFGADGSDTLVDNLSVDGAWIEYTGRA